MAETYYLLHSESRTDSKEKSAPFATQGAVQLQL